MSSIHAAPRHPRLSVVVVVYDMTREAERTLRSLSVSGQWRVHADDYEVVVVDNGSPSPLSQAYVASFGAGFRLVTIVDATCSPVAAVNRGVAEARGDAVAIMVDGARMVSPGIVAWTLSALDVFPDAAIVAASWHLGPGVQNETIRRGYDKIVEDGLLTSVDWRADGYRLFDLCERLDPSCEGAAWFAPCAEANFVACHRRVFEEVGGFDPRFASPGGGACNLDFFRRLVENGGCRVVSLVGEGTFHQLHGGVSTNVAPKDHPWRAIEAEYRAIRGRAWAAPSYDPILYGTLSPQARHLLARSPNIFTNPPRRVPAHWLREAAGHLILSIAMRLRRLAGGKIISRN